MDSVSMLGITAGAIVLAGFIPQIYKGWKTKRLDDLSYLMMGLLSSGMFLWIIYGFFRNDIVIILANAVGILLNLILIAMKFYYGKISRAKFHQGL